MEIDTDRESLISTEPSNGDGHHAIELIKQTDDIYERSNLTRLQMLYWVAEKLRSDSPIFNTILTFTIFGTVHLEHFRKAFQALLDHTDAMRVVIEDVNGIPQQCVVENVTYPIEFIDFSQQAEPEIVFQLWVEKRCKIPLLTNTRSFDSAIIKISAEKYIWYLNQHHMIADASSAFLIYERLAEFYERSIENESMTMPGLPSFENYIDYERNYRDSPQFHKSEAYWAKKLVPGPEPINFYGQQPVKKTTEVQRVSYDIGLERSQKLRTMARQKGIYTISLDLSLSNIFAAFFFVQLHYMSGNHRLGVVTPVHNRFTEASKKTVGLLMELCPFQVEISDDDTFLSLIAKVKRETRETFLHYQYGSGLALNKEMFDVMFNMHHMPALTLDSAPVNVERVHPGHATESLTLHVNDFASSNSFVLNFDFHCDVFTEEQREQAVQVYVEILDAFLEDRTSLLSDINLPMIASGSYSPPVHPPGQSLDKNEQSSVNGPSNPLDVLEMKLMQIWEELLDVRPIGVNDNFFDLGGNSFLAVRLFVQIEKVIGQYLPLTTLLGAPTIFDLARCIRQEMGQSLWSTLITIQPGKDREPLYMVPGAGGNGLAMSRIARRMGPDQPVLMFQIPLGEGEDAPPFTRIEDMASHYVAALRSVHPEGPYNIGGYSAGGLVAFEVAQQLQRQGQKVNLLAIIDVPAQSYNFKYLRDFVRALGKAPGIGDEKASKWFLDGRDKLFQFDYFLRLGYREVLFRQLVRVKGYFGRLRNFLQLDNQEKVGRVRRKLGMGKEERTFILPEKNDNPKTVEEGDSRWQQEDRNMRKYFETNNEAVKNYFPLKYPGRIVLFRSSKGYRYPEMRSPYPHLGWDKLAVSGLEIYEIPGDHMEITREPGVKFLGEQLRACLDGVNVNNK